jgi:hypothetical protein
MVPHVGGEDANATDPMVDRRFCLRSNPWLVLQLRKNT